MPELTTEERLMHLASVVQQYLVALNATGVQHGLLRLRRLTRDATIARKVIAPIALSERETAVLELMAKGHSTRQIATILGIEYHTVKNQKSSMYDKMDLHDQTSVIIYAIASGMVDFNDVLAGIIERKDEYTKIF